MANSYKDITGTIGKIQTDCSQREFNQVDFLGYNNGIIIIQENALVSEIHTKDLEIKCQLYEIFETFQTVKPVYIGKDMNKAKMKIPSGPERKYLSCGGGGGGGG